MRCPNCGWPNKPNETTCVKCGTPLEESQSDVAVTPEQRYPGMPQSPAYNGAAGGAEEPLRKTVMEGDVFGPEAQAKQPLESGYMPQQPYMHSAPSQPRQGQVCPKCGYPMRPDSNKCPNCNFIVGGQMEQTIFDADGHVSQRRTTRQPTRQPGAPTLQDPAPAPEPAERQQQGSVTSRGAEPQRKASRNVGGTVNPYLQGYEYTPTPTFSLKPLTREGEPKVPPVQRIEMDDESVVLNRNNTELGNPTITSHEQAVVHCTEDGRWFIENRSSQGTTFLQVRNRTELHQGDVLLLGNRLFEFNVEEQ